MSRGRTRTVLVTRWQDGLARRQPDQLAVEEPLAIQLDSHPVATTMRTPGHDYELAVGWCFSDGLLGGAAVTGVRYCAHGSATQTDFNVVTVETGGRAPTPTPRSASATSSCGWCGSELIDDLAGRLVPRSGQQPPPPPLSVLGQVALRVPSMQGLFASTGSVHAAAAFDGDGDIVLAREDVGRHNAVDKVVGRLVLDGALPASALGLYVSGRASFEIVQKAWSAGFGAVVAVSAPTALAVEAARRAGLLLAGFARDDRLNVYSPERMDVGAPAAPGRTTGSGAEGHR